MRNYVENKNKNRVRIEGILSETNLDYKTYKRNGVDTECICGTISVRVELADNKVLEIPINMFANKYTKDGKPNSAFLAVDKIKTEMVSIASCPNGVTPDYVRLTSGELGVREYIGEDGNIKTYPRITGTFVSKIRADECRPQANFEVEAVIASIDEEINRSGEETGRKKITAVVPGYKGTTSVLTFIAEHESVKSAIDSLWEVNSTVTIAGDLNFSSTTEKIIKEMSFGAPREESRTISVAEYVITGGSEPLDEDSAYDINDVQKGLAERKARLEASKDNSKKKEAVVQKRIDLGF